MADTEHVLLERCINERYDGGTSCLIWKMDEAAPLLNEGSRTTFVLYTWKRGLQLRQQSVFTGRDRKHCVLFGECEWACSPRDAQADTVKRGCLMSQEITHTHTHTHTHVSELKCTL